MSGVSASRTTLIAVYSLLSKFDVNQYGTVYTVVRYSNETSMITGSLTLSSIVMSEDDGRICGGSDHNVFGALRKARTEFFTATFGSYSYYSSTGDRLAIPDVVVIISTGSSTNASALAAANIEADLIKEQDVKIVTVGVGPDVNATELAGIASNATQAEKFVVDSPEDLEGLIPDLVTAMCDFSVEGTC